jgi:hypothetical protein
LQLDDQIRAANAIACMIGAATAGEPVAATGAVALAAFIRNLASCAPPAPPH